MRLCSWFWRRAAGDRVCFFSSYRLLSSSSSGALPSYSPASSIAAAVKYASAAWMLVFIVLLLTLWFLLPWASGICTRRALFGDCRDGALLFSSYSPGIVLSTLLAFLLILSALPFVYYSRMLLSLDLSLSSRPCSVPLPYGSPWFFR